MKHLRFLSFLLLLVFMLGLCPFTVHALIPGSIHSKDYVTDDADLSTAVREAYGELELDYDKDDNHIPDDEEFDQAIDNIHFPRFVKTDGDFKKAQAELDALREQLLTGLVDSFEQLGDPYALIWSVPRCDYSIYETEEVLSVLVQLQYVDADGYQQENRVYTFDLEDNRLLDNAEILEVAGFETEDLLTDLEVSIEQQLLLGYNFFLDGIVRSAIIGRSLERLWEDDDEDLVKLYFDELGKLHFTYRRAEYGFLTPYTAPLILNPHDGPPENPLFTLLTNDVKEDLENVDVLVADLGEVTEELVPDAPPEPFHRFNIPFVYYMETWRSAETIALLTTPLDNQFPDGIGHYYLVVPRYAPTVMGLKDIDWEKMSGERRYGMGGGTGLYILTDNVPEQELTLTFRGNTESFAIGRDHDLPDFALDITELIDSYETRIFGTSRCTRSSLTPTPNKTH